MSEKTDPVQIFTYRAVAKRILIIWLVFDIICTGILGVLIPAVAASRPGHARELFQFEIALLMAVPIIVLALSWRNSRIEIGNGRIRWVSFLNISRVNASFESATLVLIRQGDAHYPYKIATDRGDIFVSTGIDRYADLIALMKSREAARSAANQADKVLQS